MPLFSRKDGDLIGNVPAYRRIMPFIMPTRTESAVYFEQRIDATKGLEFIKEWNEQYPEQKITFFHLMMYGIIQAMHARPRLNRFTMGGHLYQRRGIWLSYSAKKAFNDESPLAVVKQQFEHTQSFYDVVTRLNGGVKEGKSSKRSHVDKELDLFLKLPAPILRRAAGFLRWLDTWNLLPYSFIEKDPMYATLFVASLGSVKMDSAYHHLYEYGTIALFGVLGKVHDEVVPNPDGTVRVRQEVSIKWAYDERVDDGLYTAKNMEILRQYMEDPYTMIGAVKSQPVMRAV